MDENGQTSNHSLGEDFICALVERRAQSTFNGSHAITS